MGNFQIFYVQTGGRVSDEEVARSWRVIIPWLIAHAKHYRIVCDPTKIGSPRVINLIANNAASQEEAERKVKSRLLDAALRLVSKRYPAPLVVFQGVPDQALADILLLGPLPDESVPADIAPCSEIVLSRNEEVLFTSFDYGRFQTLNITREEALELSDLLEGADMDRDILVEAEGTRASHSAPWFFFGRVGRN